MCYVFIVCVFSRDPADYMNEYTNTILTLQTTLHIHTCMYRIQTAEQLKANNTEGDEKFS